MANSWEDFAAQYMPQGSGAWGATPANPNQSQQDWSRNAGAFENQWNQATFGGGMAPNMNAAGNVGKSYEQIQAEQAAWEDNRNKGYQSLGSQITGQPVGNQSALGGMATGQPATNPYLAMEQQPQPSGMGSFQQAYNQYTTQSVNPSAQQVATSAGLANPYLPDIGNAITGAVNQNLQQNILPGINRNSVATGGYGGSRQGVAQGVAVGNASTGLAQALANLYGGAWDAQQGRDLSKYGMDQGSRTANRQIDLTQNQQGYNQFWDTINNQLGLGKAQTDIGTAQYNASKDPINTYSNLVNPYTGLGGTKTTTDPASGGGLAGAAGGALTIAQLIKLLGG
jgi:hypothetical protein